MMAVRRRRFQKQAVEAVGKGGDGRVTSGWLGMMPFLGGVRDVETSEREREPPFLGGVCDEVDGRAAVTAARRREGAARGTRVRVMKSTWKREGHI